MLKRIPMAILVGIITGLIAAVVIYIISALLPNVELDVSKWASLIGLLAGVVYLVTGENPVA